MNILIIKPGAVGDLLQLTPVMRTLKIRFPDSRITLLVGSMATAAMFNHSNNVDNIVVFDRKGAHRSWPAFLNLCRQIHAGRFDLIVNFQRSNVKAWLIAMAAFPCRILVYKKARGRTVHAVVNHLETIVPLGIDLANADLHLDMPITSEEMEKAEKLLIPAGFRHKPLIALNPGASNRIKCWSTKKFAELGDRLIDELKVDIIVVGAPDERDLAEGIIAAMRNKPLDLLGKTNLRELGALLAASNLLVSGDTGPMHMATAVGTPVVALFGAIEPLRTGPVGNGHTVIRHGEIDCVPCNGKRCKNPHYLECMEKITVEEVFDAVASMLAEGK
ncbi:ADP-heptose--lipopolysaccharide heptosyltransferase [Geotalea daltonii FRC-32]|uniref:ADP-heptose--lipopolysaccharide heptosyltransferase n=1 Tax=Geotalea daltonii (strain DSM 22248 / JCM 15807 / FRC-32) TaxID=316067 RepID=B9M8X4_GEODF|nr:glycosyltransferase family 9 protein [Geotalea daltonii]ACM20470.1 ADP-heptose--lipopolysaccharide heptosyltransferase [Geotalea daltonii FRC-32]